MSTLIVDELPVGASLNYTVSHTVDGSPIDLTGYTLQVKIKNPDGTDTTIDKMVTDLSVDNFSFIVQITPAETATLTPQSQTYTLCNLLQNTTIEFRNEESRDLKVVASCF